MLKTICATAAALAVSAALAASSHAESACPGGYRFQGPASCVETRTPGCPRGYHLNPSKTLCMNDTASGPATRTPTCPAGATLKANAGCTITRPAYCPPGKQIARNGTCVTGTPR